MPFVKSKQIWGSWMAGSSVPASCTVDVSGMLEVLLVLLELFTSAAAPGKNPEHRT
jgi:hypothetical protein